MIFLWPVTLVVALISIVLGAMREPRTLRWMTARETSPATRQVSWFLLAPSALTVFNLLWGGTFLTSAQQPPPATPWYAYSPGVVLLIEIGLAFVIFLDKRRPAHIAIAALLPQVWIGVLAAFLAAWAATSGGTLGAL